MNGEATWNIEIRHTCAKCDRLAVVYDDDDNPLCARHATIFMTAAKGRPNAGGEKQPKTS
ncbi:MAG: hypothetical protein R6W79_06405 [Acidimicrobiia bacterium]